MILFILAAFPLEMLAMIMPLRPHVNSAAHPLLDPGTTETSHLQAHRPHAVGIMKITGEGHRHLWLTGAVTVVPRHPLQVTTEDEDMLALLVLLQSLLSVASVPQWEGPPSVTVIGITNHRHGLRPSTIGIRQPTPIRILGQGQELLPGCAKTLIASRRGTDL